MILEATKNKVANPKYGHEAFTKVCFTSAKGIFLKIK
jgi:hypothetical protein